MRVGFIGVGRQGGPMARRIADGGFPLLLWARRPESLEPFTDTAASAASSPAEMGAASDVVCVCVVDDADVEQVVAGPDGVLTGAGPGTIIAVHSTVHPDTCRRLAEQAAGRGVALVDAPVSGGGVAAADRRLLVMVGGEADQVERCRPVFETFADPVVHTGPLGTAQLAKLLNNYFFTAQLALAAEAFAFGERMGVAPAVLVQVLAHGSAGSRAAEIVANTGFDLTPLRGAAPLLSKDVRITRQLAGARAVAEPPHAAGLVEATLAELGEGRKG